MQERAHAASARRTLRMHSQDGSTFLRHGRHIENPTLSIDEEQSC